MNPASPRPRPCAFPGDLAPLQRLVSANWRRAGFANTFHPGDVCWRACRGDGEFWIWEDRRGATVGAVYFVGDKAGVFDVIVRPRERGAELEATILAWAEARVPPGVAPETGCYETDAARLALLRRLGYRPVERGLVRFLHPLDGPAVAAAPPPGYRVRAFAGLGELATRERVVRAAFGTGMVSEAGWAALAAAPCYDPGLDLVAVAADGRIVAFCTAWLDRATAVGLLEPVAVDPAWHRRGLGRAVLSEALARLAGRGARRVVLATESGNTGAEAFYTACGFARVAFDREFVKEP